MKIQGKKIKAYFNFDEEWNILEQKIVEEQAIKKVCYEIIERIKLI